MVCRLQANESSLWIGYMNRIFKSTIWIRFFRRHFELNIGNRIADPKNRFSDPFVFCLFVCYWQRMCHKRVFNALNNECVCIIFLSKSSQKCSEAKVQTILEWFINAVFPKCNDKIFLKCCYYKWSFIFIFKLRASCLNIFTMSSCQNDLEES